MMNHQVCKYKFMLPLLFITTALSASEQGASNGVYASFSAGKSIQSHTSFYALTLAPYSLDLQYRRGTHLTGALGYQSNQVRYELEGMRMRARYKSIRLNAPPTVLINSWSGHTRILSVLANIFYDFNHTRHWIAPYVGMGAGLSSLKNQWEFKEGVDASKEKEIHQTFAYQAIGGARIHLTNEASLLLDYRYFATIPIKSVAKRVQAHSLNVGILYRF